MSVDARRSRRVRARWVALPFPILILAALGVGLVRVYPRHGLNAALLFLGAAAWLTIGAYLAVFGLIWTVRWIDRTVQRRRTPRKPVKTITGTVLSTRPDPGSYDFGNSSALIQLPRRTVVVYGKQAAYLTVGAEVVLEFDPNTRRTRFPAEPMTPGDWVFVPFVVIYVIATVLGCILIPGTALGYSFLLAVRVIAAAVR
jgi:hypothetical protein